MRTHTIVATTLPIMSMPRRHESRVVRRFDAWFAMSCSAHYAPPVHRSSRGSCPPIPTLLVHEHMTSDMHECARSLRAGNTVHVACYRMQGTPGAAVVSAVAQGASIDSRHARVLALALATVRPVRGTEKAMGGSRGDATWATQT